MDQNQSQPGNPEECPVAATLQVIGGKWVPLILFHLKDEPRRFNALRRLIPGITQRMLTLQLRELEEAGIVERTVYAEVPPRVDYELTELGRSLQPVLIAMRNWGQEYSQRFDAAGPLHDDAEASAPRAPDIAQKVA